MASGDDARDRRTAPAVGEGDASQGGGDDASGTAHTARAARGTGEPVRLDKWLWAARFFKTRSLSSEAVAGGKVEVNGDRVKPARPLHVGDVLAVRLGPYVHVVRVLGLAERRGSAKIAATLYEETRESREARERHAWQLRHAAPRVESGEGRPTKRDRRALNRMRGR